MITVQCIRPSWRKTVNRISRQVKVKAQITFLCGICTFLVWISATPAVLAQAESAWAGVLALDAGPGYAGNNAEQAKAAVLGHLVRQENALREFLKKYPQFHAVETRLRLAKVLQMRADLDAKPEFWEEARTLIEQAAIDCPREKRADVDFARVAFLMRSSRGENRRHTILSESRKFQQNHPDDRRVAPLLLEVSSLFDLEPERKEALLLDARKAARDDNTKARIADDLRRVAMLNRPVQLSGVSATGQPLDLAKLRGRPAVLIFFATWSPESIIAVEELNDALLTLPKGSVGLFGVSLDSERARLSRMLEQVGITWPVVCDGKGWESTAVRALGINSVPTAWIVDAEGKLRSLDARTGTVEQLKALTPNTSERK